MKSKQLQKGLAQLAEEGAVQVFRPLMNNDYILGAVGVLQFDVTAERLKHEYSATTVYESVPYVVARWVSSSDQKIMKEFVKHNSVYLANDADGNLAFLTSSEWRLENSMEEWPDIKFHKTCEHN
jgi:peptide chain release factor 3